ncbi:hypothetical protein BDN67DRAFT_966149 [Paxillus ammoniavirescens]|nr:hypothetical protein BDN67DRAFT_966149 [Paxillus ammoniavirescens]
MYDGLRMGQAFKLPLAAEDGNMPLNQQIRRHVAGKPGSFKGQNALWPSVERKCPAVTDISRASRYPPQWRPNFSASEGNVGCLLHRTALLIVQRSTFRLEEFRNYNAIDFI